jgi:hypothetical protein
VGEEKSFEEVEEEVDEDEVDVCSTIELFTFDIGVFEGEWQPRWRLSRLLLGGEGTGKWTAVWWFGPGDC